MKKNLQYLSMILWGLLISLTQMIFLTSCEEDEIPLPASLLVSDTLQISELLGGKHTKYLNQTILIKNVEFNITGTSKTDSLFNGTSSNGNGTKKLKDCNGSTIDVFTATDQAISNSKLPTGNGNIVVKVSEFNGNVQLRVRTLDDVKAMTGAKCQGSGAGANCTQLNGTATNICYIRGLYAGSGTKTTAANNTIIRGVVTSDKDGKNINANNIFFQDGTAGIVIRFTAAHSFVIGDSLEIDISGGSIEDFSGLVQVNNITIAKATKKATVTVNPKVITITQALSGSYEGQVVTIQNVTFEDAGQPFYGGGSGSNRNISDASGSKLVVRIDDAVAFGTQIIPSGSKSVTGNMGVFSSTPQLLMRNGSDVK